MPRVAVGEKLNDSINVPVTRRLKRRIVQLSRKAPGKPKPTRFARELLEQAINAADKEASPSVEPVSA